MQPRRPTNKVRPVARADRTASHAGRAAQQARTRSTPLREGRSWCRPTPARARLCWPDGVGRALNEGLDFLDVIGIQLAREAGHTALQVRPLQPE